MNIRDQSLVAAYTSLGMSVDRIAVFTEVRNAFLAQLPAELRAEQDDEAIIWQLLRLRKNRKLPTPPSEN